MQAVDSNYTMIRSSQITTGWGGGSGLHGIFLTYSTFGSIPFAMSFTPIEFFDEAYRAHHKRLSIGILGRKVWGVTQMGVLIPITHHFVSAVKRNSRGTSLVEQKRPLSFIYTPPFPPPQLSILMCGVCHNRRCMRFICRGQ